MIIAYIYFLISISIHELSHILIGKIFKIKLKNLRVSIFGASLEIEGKNKKNSIIKVLMYFSGPVINLIIAISLSLLKIDFYKKDFLIYTNILLSLFNLLPIIPLDGSNILKEVLKIKYNYIKTNKISLLISKSILAFLSFLYSIFIIKIKNIEILLFIFYLWYLNYIEEKKFILLDKTYKILNKNLEEKQKILQ